MPTRYSAIRMGISIKLANKIDCEQILCRSDEQSPSVSAAECTVRGDRGRGHEDQLASNPPTRYARHPPRASMLCRACLQQTRLGSHPLRSLPPRDAIFIRNRFCAALGVPPDLKSSDEFARQILELG